MSPAGSSRARSRISPSCRSSSTPAAAARTALVRASPAKSRCRSRVARSPAQPGSRPARSRSRARPVARPLRVPARRRRRRRPSCEPTIRRSGSRTPRPSSSAHATPGFSAGRGQGPRRHRHDGWRRTLVAPSAVRRCEDEHGRHGARNADARHAHARTNGGAGRGPGLRVRPALPDLHDPAPPRRRSDGERIVRIAWRWAGRAGTRA